MIINNSEVIQLKCSEFIHADPIINEYTVFLVSDIPYRSHDLYLILKFIIRKYKKLIFRKSYLENIEKYIELFDKSCSIHGRPSNLISSVYVEYENKLYDTTNIQKSCVNVDIEEYFLENPDISNIIVIDKESHIKNQYVCYTRE